MGLWPGDEYFARRYDFAAEYVQIMQELWTTGRSDFKGEFFQMDDCRLEPRPQVPIKLISAGQSDAGMKFIARVRRLQLRVRHGLQHADRLRSDRRAAAEGQRQQRAARSRPTGFS